MELRNNKGITLTTLVVTIILLLILASITIYGGNGLIKKAKVESLKTNMLLIQAEAKSAVEQVKFEIYSLDSNAADYNEKVSEIRSKNLIGIPLNENESLKTQMQNIAGLETDLSNFYYLTTDNLQSMNIEIDSTDNDYVVAYDINNVDVDVYYVKGYKKDNTMCYSLDDF